MKRRQFLKKSLPAAAFIPAIVDGFSIKAFAADSMLLQATLMPYVDTDHVLVIVQLNGGNDGLNTLIPLSNYRDYYNARTNIAIPEKKVLPLTGYAKAGLHPSMTGLQSLYNEGLLSILQAVGYPSPNFSHFRATDIWMTASDSNSVINSGWGGRYLNSEFPNYPNGYPNSSMPDPLAIQIGSTTTLTCQGPIANMGMSITDPTNFYNLVNGTQDSVPNTPMGQELSYIRQVAQQTNLYAQRIKVAANNVKQQSVYPTNNSLADQLKIVARLIKGGLKTRIYMVSYGGFDTHSLQAVASDTTTGAHANLLGNVSNAIKAFQDDLKFLSVDDRVLGMTFSEFGRRIKSNSSGGTDHGAAAPLFIFGKKVMGRILGNNPAIPAAITVNDNIPFQYDFRSVYASVLQNWFCVADTDLKMIMMNNFQPLDLVQGNCSNSSGPLNAGDKLISNYPNPFVQSTTIEFKTAGGHTLVQIIDASGRVIKALTDKEYTAGTYKVFFDSEPLAAGVYYARLQNGPVQQVRAMLKVR